MGIAYFPYCCFWRHNQATILLTALFYIWVKTDQMRVTLYDSTYSQNPYILHIQMSSNAKKTCFPTVAMLDICETIDFWWIFYFFWIFRPKISHIFSIFNTPWGAIKKCIRFSSFFFPKVTRPPGFYFLILIFPTGIKSSEISPLPSNSA